MAASLKKLFYLCTLHIIALTLCDGKLRRLHPAVIDSPSNDSPFIVYSNPTNVPDFHSTPYYLDNSDDQEGQPSLSPAGGDVTRRRSADPPEVRCALNRTSASLCKSSGIPIGCACDKLCHVYGDCCSDTTSQAKLEKDADFQLWRSYWWSCRKVAAEIPSPHYLMVSYCPAFWKDEYTQRLCRNYNLYDRLVNWPVHDASNGALFKNVFCAKCNGVEEVVFWSANIHCKKDFFHFKRKDALPAARGNVTAFQVKLVRNPAKTLISPQQQIRIQRRIELNNVSMADEMDRLMAEATLQRMDSATKADCALQFVPVSDYTSRSCLPFKSDCDSGWSGDVSVKMQCLNGETSFVFDADSIAYRNVHCAQCSYIDKLWCFAKRKRKKVTQPRTSPVVASVQLKVGKDGDDRMKQILRVQIKTPGKNLRTHHSKESRSGKHPKKGLQFKESIVCPVNQIYDVFHDRCRWLSCESGRLNGTECFVEEEEIDLKSDNFLSRENGSSSWNDTSTVSNELATKTPSSKMSLSTPCDGILFDLSKDESNDLPYQKIFRVLDFYSKVRSLFDTHADDDDFLYNEQRDRPLVHCYQSPDQELSPKEESFPAPFGMGDLPLLSFFAALGQGVSVLCLLVCISLCLSLEDLRHSLLSSCLACIYLSLALCQVAMIVGTPAFRHEDLTCLLLFACWHYMSLTTLTWLSATAILVLPAFLFSGTRSPLYVREIFLRDPRSSPEGHRRNCLRFTFASILSWLLPFPLTALYVLEKHETLPPWTVDPEEIIGLGLNLCWPSGRDNFLTFFAVPAGSLLFFSLLILCTVSIHVSRVGSSIYPDTLALRSWSNRLVRVIVVLVCLWSICAAAVITDMYELWLAFVCVNSIAGVVLLLDILISIEVKKACSGCSRRKDEREEVKMEMIVGREGDRMIGETPIEEVERNEEVVGDEKGMFVSKLPADQSAGEPVEL